MTVIIHDNAAADQFVAERKAMGLDVRDEVWEGVYVVSAMADLEHQLIVERLSTILGILVDWTGRGLVFAGCNVSDRDLGWKQNYRIPDIAVFLKEGAGVLHRNHAEGGPDFLVEVLSDDDPSPRKLSFYFANGVREALFVHRDPSWKLELYRSEEGSPHLVETVFPDGEEIRCEVVPVALRLVADPEGGRPSIDVRQTDGGLRRLVLDRR